jgi:hypothetical protein
MPKIFFATDLHGSEMCWRKFINAACFYDCETGVRRARAQRTRRRTSLPGD